MSYVARLIAVTVALNLGLWVFGYAWLEQSHRQYVDSTITATKNLSALMFHDLEASYQQTDWVLQGLIDQISDEKRHGTFDSDRFDDVLRRRIEHHPALVALSVTNAQGDVVRTATRTKLVTPVNTADRHYFQRLRDDPSAGLVISEPVQGRVSGKWGVIFARRINAADGSFAGVVLANLGMAAIEEKFAGLDVGPNGSIALRDDNLALVLRLPYGKGPVAPGARVISSDYQQALARDPMVGTYVSGSTSIDGITRVHSYRRHPAFGFIINLGLAHEDFLDPWHRQQRITFLVMLAFALVSGAGTWILIRGWRQQQRSASELAASAERLRSIIDASPVPSAMNDDRGNITYLNPAFVQTFGYTLNETSTLEVWWQKAYPDPEYRQWVIDTWSQHMEVVRRTGAPFMSYEVKVHCRDGSVRSVLASAASIHESFGKEHLVVLYDITEQRRADEAVRLSEERYTLAVNASNDGIWDWNIVAGTAYLSPRWKGLLGYADDELQSSPEVFFEAIHPDDKERISNVLKRHFDDEEAYQVELRMRCKDGEYRWFLSRGQVMLDEDGQPLRMVGALALIHERKLAEVELKQHREHLEELVTQRTDALGLREHQFRLILDSVPGVISYFDAEQRLVFANKAYQHFLGIDPVVSAGKTLREMYGAPLYEAIQPQVERVLAGEYCEFVRTYPTPTRHDGTSIAQVYYVPDNHSGTVRGFFVLAFDITELVKAREAAEAASLSKTRFLANMSHEIRTPLTAIMGMSNLVRRSGVTPQQANRLEKLDGAAKHLLEIINVVLDLAKIESGKFAVDEALVSIPAIVEDVMAMMSERAQVKNLQVIADIQDHFPSVMGDPTRIRQALLNYLGNAIKFTDKGTITVRVARGEESADTLRAHFEVEDTGPGIDEATMARLFSPFEQADNSVTRQHGGTGLGLVITQRLAQLMGGEAGVSSQLGQGSKFWFTVCLRKDMQASRFGRNDLVVNADAKAILQRDYSAIRVLIVDDDQFNCEILASLMEDIGVAFDQANDGVQAVAAVQQAAYDVILMDMQMPELDGVEAAQRIRQLANGRKSVIIATTANAFPEDRANCLAAGMNDFLAKPFAPDVLYGKMLAWLPSRQTP